MIKTLFQPFVKILPQLLFAILVGSTLATSTSAGIKVIQAASKNTSQNIATVKPTEQKEESVMSDESTPDNLNESIRTNTPISPTPTNRISLSSATLTPTPFPTAATTPKLSQGATNLSSQCIITLWSNQYNVTSLRNTHSGGDIFKCGTDMTAVYQQQHGTNLSRMQPYLVTSTTGSNTNSQTGTPTPTPGGSSSNSSFRQGDDETETESEQKRYEHTKEIESTEKTEVED